ncbi:uncharacterized protein LOC143230975 isoform X2 [Tachypleus tridentatus]|uniref:uncharacterized protein LOC143230975 isoform X2 n=2 Tax=Tachypleus tridentatus TaxID=6853 RepID=UPI003FD1F5C4
MEGQEDKYRFCQGMGKSVLGKGSSDFTTEFGTTKGEQTENYMFDENTFVKMKTEQTGELKQDEVISRFSESDKDDHLCSFKDDDKDVKTENEFQNDLQNIHSGPEEASGLTQDLFKHETSISDAAMEILEIKIEPVSGKDQNVVLDIKLMESQEKGVTLPSTTGIAASLEKETLYAAHESVIAKDGQEMKHAGLVENTENTFIMEQTNPSGDFQEVEDVSRFSKNDDDLDSPKIEILGIEKENVFQEEIHQLDFEIGDSRTYMKNHCGRQFCDYKDLMQEALDTKISNVQKLIYDDKYGKTLARENAVRFQISYTGDKLYSCITCDKEFGRKSELNTHQHMHTGERPYTCFVCGKEFRKSRHLNKHKKIHTGDRPYSCVVCSKNFGTKTHLKTHLLIHTGEKPYRCVVCGKEFGRSSHLERHKKIHTGEKQYSCSVCDKKFRTKSHVKTHLMIHTGEKPFCCVVCGKEFGSNSDLKKHNRTHTGEKPHICIVCGKKFGNKNQLEIHERTHTGEKPYSCEVCAKEFGSNSDLRKHNRIHTREKPYICVVCRKEFGTNSNLKTHMITHTGEKPYSCVVCEKEFRRRSDLKVHQRIHTGEKPYRCEVCGKKFGRSTVLSKHKRTHI